jgi:hypothetical protein
LLSAVHNALQRQAFNCRSGMLLLRHFKYKSSKYFIHHTCSSGGAVNNPQKPGRSILNHFSFAPSLSEHSGFFMDMLSFP